MSSTPSVPSVPIPEILYITEVFEKALAIPESVSLRKPLCDAIREVLVEYIARSAVAVFMEDNVKFVPTEVLEQKRSA